MMDCKRALEESGGDMEQAERVLREKGMAAAAKKAGRIASEGIVDSYIHMGGRIGVMLEVNCETDFVAKNEGYKTLVESLMKVAIDNSPATSEELLSLKFDDKLTVADKITEQIGVIGEKLELSGYGIIKGGGVVAYNHPGNQLATLVAVNKNDVNALEAGRQVAMQVAAMSPIALNKDGVDERTIEREIEIGKELAIQEGKPADMAEKIAKGRLEKFFKENTLLSQEFIRDNKLTVEQFLNSTEKGLTVTEFKRVSLS
jgi:elongation factor Ts